jgi:hypothetical protein
MADAQRSAVMPAFLRRTLCRWCRCVFMLIALPSFLLLPTLSCTPRNSISFGTPPCSIVFWWQASRYGAHGRVCGQDTRWGVYVILSFSFLRSDLLYSSLSFEAQRIDPICDAEPFVPSSRDPETVS